MTDIFPRKGKQPIHAGIFKTRRRPVERYVETAVIPLMRPFFTHNYSLGCEY